MLKLSVASRGGLHGAEQSIVVLRVARKLHSSLVFEPRPGFRTSKVPFKGLVVERSMKGVIVRAHMCIYTYTGIYIYVCIYRHVYISISLSLSLYIYRVSYAHVSIPWFCVCIPKDIYACSLREPPGLKRAWSPVACFKTYARTLISVSSTKPLKPSEGEPRQPDMAY